MSPNPSRPGGVRSSAAVNAEIRALLVRTGGWLSEADRVEYRELVAEWTAAERLAEDIAEAA